MSLFASTTVVGTFLGFSEGGMEFHADLLLPYQSGLQSSPIHGQFMLVGLEHDAEAVLGRVTAVSAHGRLVSPTGEDYVLRQQRENRPIPDELRDQYLKYRVDIRILGVLREKTPGEPPAFVPSHRRLPHVGAKVAFLSDDLLRYVAGATADPATTAELGFLALGEFVYGAGDPRATSDPRLEVRKPAVLPRFDIHQLVSRRSFVFARAGFGKSNLVKLLFASLYGNSHVPTVVKRGGRRVPVGTVIFDADGEYFWPDDKGRPGLCDVPGLLDRVAVFTDKEPPTDYYHSFVAADTVKLDIRELPPHRVLSLVIPAERQDQQNVAKLRQLKQGEGWTRLVDAVHARGNGTDLDVFYEELHLTRGSQEYEALAARSNLVRVVSTLHDPASQLLGTLKRALREGRLCIVDISRMRGPHGLALAGVILEEIFEHNQDQFTRRDSRTIPTIAVVEEAQSVLGAADSAGEGPFVAWVKEGRKYDLGAMLITQQPGSISGEILSQGDNWFVFHLLSERDLRALRQANSHFSEDLLASLLNEPIPGHGVFWSSAGERPYPIPLRALSFEAAHEVADPHGERAALDCYAARLRGEFAAGLAAAARQAGDGAAAGVADPVETYIRAAIAGLRRRPEFYHELASERGIAWARVHRLLAAELTCPTEDPGEWIRENRVVKRALLELLGEENQAWRTERRPSRRNTGRENVWIRPLVEVRMPRASGEGRGASGEGHTAAGSSAAAAPSTVTPAPPAATRPTAPAHEPADEAFPAPPWADPWAGEEPPF